MKFSRHIHFAILRKFCINRNATDYVPGVETESSSDEEDQDITTE